MSESNHISDSEVLSVTSNMSEMKNIPEAESNFISDIMKKITTTELLYGIGFCIIILLIIGGYLYYKNKCDTETSQISEKHVIFTEAVINPREAPRKMQKIIEESESLSESVSEQKSKVVKKVVKIEHPKLSESDEVQSNTQNVSQNVSQNVDKKLDQYNLTNSELNEINIQLKKVSPQ
jgi:hypothetical protein